MLVECFGISGYGTGANFSLDVDFAAVRVVHEPDTHACPSFTLAQSRGSSWALYAEWFRTVGQLLTLFAAIPSALPL